MEGHHEATEKDAFVAAYDEYSEAIFRYCLFKVFDRERSKEIMQESFMKTWEYLETGKKIDNMRAFLYRVAHNLCVNAVLRRKPQSLDAMREETGFDVEDEGVSRPEERAEADMLAAAMLRLAPKHREALAMRYLDDLPVSDIARVLGLRPNTASVRIRRAEQALRNIYEKK